MEESRVKTILEWPEPRSIRDIQAMIGFTNFYRRFIKHYSRITVPLTEMLKGQPAKKKGVKRKGSRGPPGRTFALRGAGEFLTPKAKVAYRELLRVFIERTMNHHFNAERKSRVETDSSGCAISGVFSQLKEELGQWLLVAFYSRKMNVHERNYGIHDQELLAIVESVREWRHYLEGSSQPIKVITNHDSLRYF